MASAQFGDLPSKMRQIGIELTIYAQSNKGWLVPVGRLGTVGGLVLAGSLYLDTTGIVVPGQVQAKEERISTRSTNTGVWTRYLTVGLSGVQTWFVAHWLQVNGVGAPTWGFLFTTILTLTTGTIFVMWLGEQITERGVGNGISLLIFAGIVIGLPNGVQQVLRKIRGGDTMEVIGVFAMIVALVGIIAFIVFVESARRKIPVSYAKRHVGRHG